MVLNDSGNLIVEISYFNILKSETMNLLCCQITKTPNFTKVKVLFNDLKPPLSHWLHYSPSVDVLVLFQLMRIFWKLLDADDDFLCG